MEVEALRTALAKANMAQDVHVVGPVEKVLPGPTSALRAFVAACHQLQCHQLN